MCLGLTACSSLQPPPRPSVYDFGPGIVSQRAVADTLLQRPVALVGVQAVGALDGSAVLYRLAYNDPQQLRPYAAARWTTPPAELLRQRMREHLAQSRAVLNPADGVHATGAMLTLRLELEEFTQVFDSAERSTGLLRLRATVSQSGTGVERLVAQRSFVVQQPSATPDATGGVRALTVATDTAIQEIEQWLRQVDPHPSAGN